MPRYAKFLLGVSSLLFLAVGLGGGNVYAHHTGLSPFVVIRGANTHEPKIMNPTKYDIFAVAIYYWDDESLNFCESFDLSPHDMDYGSTYGNSGNGSGMVEIIAGRSGDNVSAVDHRIGIVVSTGKGRVGVPLDPAIFNVTGDALLCICDELSNNGESPKLFAKFGVKC